MVQGIPYVHWKIKDAVDLSEIDPVYLWGTVIESDKGPIDTPVFCTNADQVKQIFNYDLNPFFVNGGRSVVIVRAYAGVPKKAEFDFELDEPFRYVYAEYDYYDDEKTDIKATVNVNDPSLKQPKAIKTGTVYSFTSYSAAESGSVYGTGIAQETGNTDGTLAEIVVISNSADTPEQQFTGKKFYIDAKATPNGQTRYELFNISDKIGTGIFVSIEPTNDNTLNVIFYEGRWRVCDENGLIKYWDNDVLKTSVKKEGFYYKEDESDLVNNADMQSFNESDVKKVVVAEIETIAAGESVINLQTLYPGDFSIPVSVQKDIRAGYRVSIKESDDYTILLAGATTLENIEKRINERADNIEASLTSAGKKVEKVFKSSLLPVTDEEKEINLPGLNDIQAAKEAYTAYIQENNIPVGSIFAKKPESDSDSKDFEFKLVETVTYFQNGSNGLWDSNLHRIADPSNLQKRQMIAAAHKEALDFLANIKLSGIFCNYGEDEVQKVYADHVSTTEPAGMNSTEVCKWRTLILGANAFDRTNGEGYEPGFKLIDKAISLDNENILFLGQGLIDDGYAPEANVMINPNPLGKEKYISLLAEDEGAKNNPNQLLPFQCTQYVAGLRSKLFYGDAIFGGEAKKEIIGVGNVSIAPLFTGENKVLWQPDNYVNLNQHGVLTFTTDYNILSLSDGITTRQTPLEEDEEGVQSIVKYAKHIVHEELQRYIGRNLTGDLEQVMENAVKALLGQMQTQDQTLIAIPSEGYPAYDVNIVLVPKSNAQQLLAKAYVYLKLTPVHALRQVEVELTVQ